MIETQKRAFLILGNVSFAGMVNLNPEEAYMAEYFTNDPINWLKWAVVFAVLISSFVINIKILKKIEYSLSLRKKADEAEAKGHIIRNAKRVRITKKYGLTDDRRNKPFNQRYHATYEYELDGEVKRYNAYFGYDYPPAKINLYYKKNPKRLFSMEEYYWNPFEGIFYLSFVFSPFLLAALTALALDIPLD